MKWDWYEDGITKARVFTLTANGVRWSPASHIDGHGVQVYGERTRLRHGGDKVMRYFPVIRTGPYGEEEHSLTEGFRFVKDAKAWVVAKAVELGIVRQEATA